MYEVNIFESSDDEDLPIVRRRRNINERPDYMNTLDEEDFFTRFRMKKVTVQQLYNEIGHTLESPTRRNHAVQGMTKLLLTLRYLALGTMFTAVGDFAGISKTAAWAAVHETCNAIANLRATYIKFLDTQAGQNEAQLQFYNIARFPRVVGALDCTHVRIQSPGGRNSEYFRNRKGYFSLNVQAICDAQLCILDIVCRWPGSSHDQTIFNNSSIRRRFERGDFGQGLLLGDSGYQVTNHVIPPILQPANEVEELFNESQIRTRNVVERMFGVWKRRFPILSGGLKVHVERVEAVVVATAVLHNIACMENEEIPPEEMVVQDINGHIPDEPVNALGLPGRNDHVRRALIRDHFANLLNH